MTQPLDLNLATHPFRNNTLLWVAHGVACASLLAFSVWNVTAFLDESSSLKELRGQVSQVAQRMTALDMRDQRAQAGIARHDLKDLSIQAGTANEVILMKALSWTRLFNLLEKVVPYEVKTIAVRPSFAEMTRGGPASAVPEEAVPITMQGLSQSIEAFLELERSLIVDPHFDQVEPEKTDVVPGGEVAFQLAFLYYPEGRREEKKIPDLPHFLEAAAVEQGSPENLPGGSEGDEGEAAAEPAAVAAPPPPAAPAGRGAPPPARPPVPRVEKGGKR